jgi:hypothetical protein
MAATFHRMPCSSSLPHAGRRAKTLVWAGFLRQAEPCAQRVRKYVSTTSESGTATHNGCKMVPANIAASFTLTSVTAGGWGSDEDAWEELRTKGIFCMELGPGSDLKSAVEYVGEALRRRSIQECQKFRDCKALACLFKRPPDSRRWASVRHDAGMSPMWFACRNTRLFPWAPRASADDACAGGLLPSPIRSPFNTSLPLPDELPSLGA